MSKAKPSTLVSWIGGNDLKTVGNSVTEGLPLGPIASTLKAQSFDAVELLYNYPEDEVRPYLTWLEQQTSAAIQARSIVLSSPVDYGEVYQAANKHLEEISSSGASFSILLSPGTPTMQAVWVLLGKTRYPCRFYQSSVEQGVQEVDIPFELSAEYIPAARELGSLKISQLAGTDAPIDAAFDNIITRNPCLQMLKAQAQILAEREVPVLIYGETGTGKEVVARALHEWSDRAAGPFVSINCAAIPENLVESELFGHVKGAFSGAVKGRPGRFVAANGGTLFLDEIGDMPLAAQAKLLRALQEGRFEPVGSDDTVRVDVRVIAASHVNLEEAIQRGTFREDLFFRLAAVPLHLPALRERREDILPLAQQRLDELSGQRARADNAEEIPRWTLHDSAAQYLLTHHWPGNIRELLYAVERAAALAPGNEIHCEHLVHRRLVHGRPSHFAPPPAPAEEQLLSFAEAERRHLLRALEQTNGKIYGKDGAAALLGLKPTTLQGKLKKHGLK